MTHDWPHLADVGGSILHADQAEPDKVWVHILAAGSRGNGVSSGCAVTPQGSPDMTVAVASGTIVWEGTEVVVASGNVTVTAAHATNPRIDLIVVSSAGVKSCTAGTAAADPVCPAIPANSVVLAEVYVPANDTAINTNQIVDKRVSVRSPLGGGSLWTTVSKTADESRTSTTVLAVDSTLKFTMAANTKYRIRATLHMFGGTTAVIKFGFNGPASPTIIEGEVNRKTAVATTWSVTGVTAYDTTGVSVNAINSHGTIQFDIIVHNGANAGDFQITWAQNVSSGNATIMRAGSFLEYAVA